MYWYPNRSVLFEEVWNVLNTMPKVRRQALLQDLVYYGWQPAKTQINEWLEERRTIPQTPPPLMDENKDPTRRRLNLFLYPEGPSRRESHRDIIEYYESLGSGLHHQIFLRLAVVLGYQTEDGKKAIQRLSD
jgi:hypothetical protein